MKKPYREVHGMTHTLTYRTWCMMIQRVTNRNYQKSCPRYRKITICTRWRNSFIAFFEDMGERPYKNATLERVNNNLGYGPDNCIWADRKTQARNNSRNVKIDYQGKIWLLTDLARYADIEEKLLATRIRAGVDIDTALMKKNFKTNKPLKKYVQK